ncbi:hypothetical protein RhiirA5_506333 [Rhizophagus irregularis]|uniref:Uncharacterized protein n=1 Tax=Rhizophagus irregularis TaxID=588596 RepID=A0A2N0NU57_9GLOM|nr:hypothetical protein RhiirA5_506333 [Rhizophagus irregularis]
MSTANWAEHGTLGRSELSLPPPIGSVHDKLANESSKGPLMTNLLTANWMHYYFTSVEAGFWSLKHYVDWIVKNESELPLWETCLADFYGSSEFIVKHRSLPRLDRVIAEKIIKAKELPETKKHIEDLRIPYERAYDGKYGKSIYKTIVHDQQEENIFVSASKKMRMKKEKVQGEECVSKNDNCILISEDEYNKENVDDEDEFGVMDKNLYTQRFNMMENSRKWKLESGRFVEDVLYELGMKCRYHNLVHSFIVDPTDEFIKNAFKEEELSEIIKKENGKDPLEIDDEILEYINTFAKDSTKEIRVALNTPHRRLGGNYNPKNDFVYEHVRTTVSDWVRLLEMQPNPLTLDMPEAWYRINVWRSIDIAFSDMPYTYVVGSTSSERKNRHRTLPNTEPIQRKAIGKKGDAYVRTIGSTSTDWAASEAGHKWEGTSGTKLMKELGFTLPRTLKDILINLAGKIHFGEGKLRKLNVVGFAHAGAVLIRSNLDCPAGYICRYIKGDPLEVYADVNNFSKSLDVLIELICSKLLILQTMKVINGGMDSQNNIARWKQQVKSESSNVSITIPDVHPSPKKRRIKEMENGTGSEVRIRRKRKLHDPPIRPTLRENCIPKSSSKKKIGSRSRLKK